MASKMETRINQIRTEVAKLNDKCAVASGNPSFAVYNASRSRLLNELSGIAVLTRTEHIQLYGYESWLSMGKAS